jgi:hypothetical protein
MNLIPFRATSRSALGRIPIIGRYLEPIGVSNILNWLVTAGTAGATAWAHARLRQKNKEG